MKSSQKSTEKPQKPNGITTWAPIANLVSFFTPLSDEEIESALQRAEEQSRKDRALLAKVQRLNELRKEALSSGVGEPCKMQPKSK